MKYQKMHTRHLKAVLEIEEATYEDPWTRKQLRDMLPNEDARLFVVVEEKEVLGYMILFNANEGWIIENLTVAEPYRRQKIGTELLNLARKTIGEGKIRIYVADKYLPMHLLLRENDYLAVKVEKDVGGEDYYLFENELQPECADQS